MTSYNREKDIGFAIESVLGQTFKDWELIIVDDCSRDRTVEVAKSFEAKEPRIRIFLNERNLGDYPNRNHAASFARGQFLKYHDSDDILYPHCLAMMVPLLEQEPGADIAVTTEWAWDGGPCPMLLTPRMCYQREFLGFGMFNRGPANVLFRTEFFKKVNGFTLAGPHSDLVFWLEVCQHARVLLVPGDLYWYRIHAGQHLQSPDRKSVV